jgi:hypothetical protein
MNDELGPLAPLVGTWIGDKGADLSPSSSGPIETPYRETLTFSVVGCVTNAEKQELQVLRYLQQVHSLSSGEGIHDETGYWMWDAKTNRVMKSTAIPRGVVAVMEGTWDVNLDTQKIDLTLLSPENEAIVQPTWMKEKAKTTSMTQQWALGPEGLSYNQLMILEIYGKEFHHTDSNLLNLKT